MNVIKTTLKDRPVRNRALHRRIVPPMVAAASRLHPPLTQGLTPGRIEYRLPGCLPGVQSLLGTKTSSFSYFFRPSPRQKAKKSQAIGIKPFNKLTK
jgi:hypothetical protein